MAIIPQKELKWITVKTTLPASYEPVSARKPIRSERLVIRSFTPEDLDAYHGLRSEADVMQWTAQARPDADVAATQKNMAQFLSPQGDNTNVFIIALPETGELVGTIGIRLLSGSMGWPEIGYMLRSKFWGKGYATEINRAYMDYWWQLPRQEALVEIKVDENTVNGAADGDVVPELITALIDERNAASKKVLDKLGFRFTTAWEETNPYGVKLIAHGFVLEKPQ